MNIGTMEIKWKLLYDNRVYIGVTLGEWILKWKLLYYNRVYMGATLG